MGLNEACVCTHTGVTRSPPGIEYWGLFLQSLGTWGVPPWLRTTELVRTARVLSHQDSLWGPPRHWAGGQEKPHPRTPYCQDPWDKQGTYGAAGGRSVWDWDKGRRYTPGTCPVETEVEAPGWADHNPVNGHPAQGPGECDQSSWPCPHAGGELRAIPATPGLRSCWQKPRAVS